MNDEKYFLAAKKVASMSTFKRIHIGCVVVYKGNIISSGYNANKTHPLQMKYNKERFDANNTPHYIHAEIHALTSLINDPTINWRRVHLYVYRIYNKTSFGLSRPCPSCMKLIKDLGIRNIHYTTNEGYAYEVLNDTT